MPLATATVSGVSIQVGTSLPRPGVVTATLADPYISDDAANAIYSGVDAETVAADGTFSLTLPAGYVYTFRFAPDDADPGWTIGPALVTVDTGIDDLVTVTAAGVDSVNIGALDHGNQSGTLTLAATIGLQEVTLTGDLAVTPTGPVGTSVMLAAHQDGTGGHALTFTDATLTVDGWTMPTTGFALIVFNHLYSGWLASPAGVTLAAGDTTAPTAGTLAASAITSDGFTLTVTGAADETALAALPYRFSIDNGTTWSAWRSTPYVATGLAASTAYTCQHQTRDAAGNVTNGQPVEGTTLALTITDPTALGSCLAYFDASDAAKLTVNGGDVTSWAASGGTHSWTYTQDGAGTLPTVAQVNGKNAVALSADGARLMARVGGTVAPHFDIGGAKTAPFTVWQILKVTATGGGGVVAQWTPGIQAQMQATVGTIFGLGGHIVSAAVYQLGEVFLLALTSNATPNSKLYRGSQMVGQVNNAAGATLFGEAADTVNYTYVGANGQTLRATLCEFGFHMKELTVADLTELQNYATAKWGAA